MPFIKLFCMHWESFKFCVQIDVIYKMKNFKFRTINMQTIVFSWIFKMMQFMMHSMALGSSIFIFQKSANQLSFFIGESYSLNNLKNLNKIFNFFQRSSKIKFKECLKNIFKSKIYWKHKHHFKFFHLSLNFCFSFELL